MILCPSNNCNLKFNDQQLLFFVLFVALFRVGVVVSSATRPVVVEVEVVGQVVLNPRLLCVQAGQVGGASVASQRLQKELS